MSRALTVQGRFYVPGVNKPAQKGRRRHPGERNGVRDGPNSRLFVVATSLWVWSVAVVVLHSSSINNGKEWWAAKRVLPREPRP